jgi:hypothetical protein
MGRPGPAAALLTIAALTAFFAHEPLLIALGHRGSRARREDGPRARRAFAWLSLSTLLVGALGLALAPPSARLAAIAPLLLTAIVARFIARADERSMLGEIAAAAALSAAALPVALAAGVPVSVAVEAFVAFCIAFGAATWSVRSVIAFPKTRTVWTRRLAPLLLPVIAVTLLFLRGLLSAWALLATAPMLLISIVLSATPPHPRSLRKVGFCLLGASALSTALLIAGARCPLTAAHNAPNGPAHACPYPCAVSSPKRRSRTAPPSPRRVTPSSSARSP